MAGIWERLFPLNRLGVKMSQSVIWLAAGSGAGRGLSLMKNMILTRLLAPEAFGLMAIILAINSAFESFTEVGIRKAIIQHPRGEEHKYLNGAWWFAIIRALALYCTAYAASPWVAQFYNNSGLISLMRIGFLSILFNGMMSSRAYVAIKNMNFARWVIIYHGGDACGILMTISLASFYHNVWALVFGFAFGALARAVLSFVICPYRPGFSFDKSLLKDLFKYARGMLGIPVLTFIFMRADVFVLGKLCSPSSLGLYVMAAALARIPFELVTSIMNQIIMPTFSKMQTEKDKINKVLIDVTKVVAILGFPLLLFVSLYGQDVLSLAYGSQYAEAAAPFAVIFAASLMRTCSVPIAQVYFATAHPELHRLFVGVRAILIIILVIPCVKWFGLTGAAAAGLVSMLISYFFQILTLRRLTQLDLWSYCRLFISALAISPCVVLIWVITYKILPSHLYLRLLSGIFGCLLSYIISAYGAMRIEKWSIRLIGKHATHF